MERPTCNPSLFSRLSRKAAGPILATYGIKNRVGHKLQNSAIAVASRSAPARRPIRRHRRCVLRRIIDPDFMKRTPPLRALVAVAAVQALDRGQARERQLQWQVPS